MQISFFFQISIFSPPYFYFYLISIFLKRYLYDDMICIMKQTNLSKLNLHLHCGKKQSIICFFFFNIFILDCELENE